MAVDVVMPQMGESVIEGIIVRWLVKPGDRVSEDQSLCEVSTDKVDTEIPSPAAGVIGRILAEPGKTVPVGAKIAEIVEASEATGAAPEHAAGPGGEPAAARQTERLAPAAQPAPMPAAGGGPAAGPAPAERLAASQTENEPPEAAGAGAPAAQEQALAARSGHPAPAPAPERGPRRYSPVVRKIAAEQGIDLARLPGTGAGGRVTKRDLLGYLEAVRAGAKPAPAGLAPTGAGGAAPARLSAAALPEQAAGPFQPPVYQPREGDTVEPFSRRRRIIAEHMVYSKTHAPHVGTLAEADLSRAMALRQTHREAFAAREGFALTLLPLAAAAVVRALKEFPRMNASIVGQTLAIRREINLGIAVDTEDGLLVPVIKGAGDKSMVELARAIERLRRRVAERRITADELSGGSFTLSNPGREGNLFGFAIINQPQVGILRMGEIKKRPVVVSADGSDAVAVRPMIYLALSYDHRVIDGVLGNRFLYRVARLLEAAEFEL